MRALLLIVGFLLAAEGSGIIPCLADSAFVTAYPKLPAIRDKTLVAWVAVAPEDQHGGSVLSLDANDRFDGLVFGEIKRRAWMAGSDMYRRTELDQASYPEETAGSTQFLRMAAVYERDMITLYRDNRVIASYRTKGPQVAFGDGAAVLIGLRHKAVLGARGSYFAGIVKEARIYDRALTAKEIGSLRAGRAAALKPVGRWTFQDGTARDVEGHFPPGVLFGGAAIRSGRLYLNGKDACMITPSGIAWRSAFHFRPSTGNVGDTIPFFWKGEYHVFYLQGGVGLVPWQHIVSSDLVRWRELPTALKSDGAPDGPDGGDMFTGSVTEKDGTFHIFYTGHNSGNPAAQEVVRHATSPDLIHWTKSPTFSLRPDGIHYSAKRGANWRDPYVFWNAEERKWWMLVIASDPKDPTEPGRSVQGLLVSDDLMTWEQRPAIPGTRGEECPDLFRIGSEWYLLGAGRYVASSVSCGGPYSEPAHSVIDYPGIYAGKRMFDGERHIWVGWAWDGPALTDAAVAGEGVLTWGGFMCLPRELYAGPQGELFCRPAREIVGLFSKTVHEASAGEEGPIPMPGDGMVECTLRLEPGAEVTLSLREQSDGRAYRLTVRPAEGKIVLATPASAWVRSACQLDPSKPVTLRVFLDGSMLECFVNEEYAITRRIYDLDGGAVRVTHAGGDARVVSLRIKEVAR